MSKVYFDIFVYFHSFALMYYFLINLSKTLGQKNIKLKFFSLKQFHGFLCFSLIFFSF